MLVHQVGTESIVSGRDGSMCREASRLCDFAKSVFERVSVFFHFAANRFERCERAMTFVEVINTDRDAHGLERLDATDAKHQLLSNSCSLVATVQATGE